jgi:hypothetical protein
MSHCKLDKFGYKEMSVPVPWCYELDMRILIGYGKWLCDECAHAKEDWERGIGYFKID